MALILIPPNPIPLSSVIPVQQSYPSLWDPLTAPPLWQVPGPNFQPSTELEWTYLLKKLLCHLPSENFQSWDTDLRHSTFMLLWSYSPWVTDAMCILQPSLLHLFDPAHCLGLRLALEVFCSWPFEPSCSQGCRHIYAAIPFFSFALFQTPPIFCIMIRPSFHNLSFLPSFSPIHKYCPHFLI